MGKVSHHPRFVVAEVETLVTVGVVARAVAPAGHRPQRSQTLPRHTQAFVAEYQQNEAAQREQQERGSLRAATAERMAADATATAAAAAAARVARGRSGGGNLSQGSMDYGSCAIDWATDGGNTTRGAPLSASAAHNPGHLVSLARALTAVRSLSF